MQEPTAIEVIDAITDKAMELSKSMSVNEVAAFYGVNKNQVLRYAQSGLPYYRMGNKYKFILSEVIKYRETFREKYGETFR